MKTTISRSSQPLNSISSARSSTGIGQKSRPNILVARSLRQARRANH